MIKIASAIMLLVCLALPARADVQLQYCPWGPELPPHASIASGGVGGSTVLGLAGPTPPDGLCVLQLDTSHLASTHIALRGTIAQNHTLGTVTLTLRAEFPDGKVYVSQESYHPNQARVQDSDFRLPMHGTNSPPARVTLYIAMAGEGEIILGPVTLWDITPPITSNAWWSNRTGGWIGGSLGTALGLIGALIGILRSRLQCERLVSALMQTTIALGLLLLLTGVVAICLHQPYAVYYPLLLCGLLAIIIFTPLLLHSRHLRQQTELRKIRALDAS